MLPTLLIRETYRQYASRRYSALLGLQQFFGYPVHGSKTYLSALLEILLKAEKGG